MKYSTFILFLVCSILLFSSFAAYSQVEMYLYPNINTDKQQLQFFDIARIVGDETIRESIGAITIDPACYADNLVDRSEIRRMLQNISQDNLRIYGSAVRIRYIRPVTNRTDFKNSVHRDRIRSGEKVSVIIRRNGLMIQTPATAIGNGKRGDFIKVKLKDSRKIKGRISSDGDIEVWM